LHSLSSGSRIKVEGRSLLLAAGNGIGTSAGVSVRAVLLCGPANTSTAHFSNVAGVALAASGDFTIEDTFTPPPPAPAQLRRCSSSPPRAAAGWPPGIAKNDSVDRD
jgi:hypothetical protein